MDSRGEIRESEGCQNGKDVPPLLALCPLRDMVRCQTAILGHHFYLALKKHNWAACAHTQGGPVNGYIWLYMDYSTLYANGLIIISGMWFVWSISL